MVGILASIGCLLLVWGLPVLSVGLIIKMVAEVRQERTRQREEAARRKALSEGVWPPPPEAPGAKRD